MAFFTRLLAKPATHVSPTSASDELQTIEEEYRQAEKAFSKASYELLRFQQVNREAGSVLLVGNRAYCRVNALTLINPDSARLFTLREEARSKRNSLLQIRADLLRRA